MHRVTSLVGALVLVAGSLAQEPPQKGAGPGKPLSPAEAQKLFKLDDGLKIELVACEPQIESPVAMQFDPDGRLWVVEMRDYPNGPRKESGEKPLGRIRILEDKDGDGFFETSTIWADNLLFANGMLLWKDGAIVTMAPKITHLRDPQGKGKATQEDILYTGFAAQNPQLRVSHPNLGLDGWIYCANGLRGGKVIRSPLPTGGEGPGVRGEPVDLSGMDFRFDPLHLDQYEAITGPGQFGNTFDEWGNRFICDNRHHLRHVVMEQKYVKRNPYLAAPSLVEDISVLEDGPLNSGGKVYPISKNWTTSSLHEGRFTAACGVFIYHGQLLDTANRKNANPNGQGLSSPLPPPILYADASALKRAGGEGGLAANLLQANLQPKPPLYHGAAFTCEPTGNLVHMEILTPKGATFTAKPHKQGVEFLATTDDWFRPVFLTHGPDGAMYVVDMYRAVIEHPDFMPPELKNRPDLWAGKDKGRIWRITPKAQGRPSLGPRLSKASIAELVKTLEHEEPWWRTTAQRLLLEKNDKAMIEPLTKLLETTKSPHAKILAAWLLERQSQLPNKYLDQMIRDDNPRVQENAYRIVEPSFGKIDRGLDVIVLDLADGRIAFQQALLYGGTRYARHACATLAVSHQADPWVRLAVETSLPGEHVFLFKKYIEMAKDRKANRVLDSVAFAREMAAMIAARDNDNAFIGSIDALRQAPEAMKWAAVAGFVDGLERRGLTLASVDKEKWPEDTRKPYSQFLQAAWSGAGKGAANSKTREFRLIFIRILSQAPWPTAKAALIPLAEKEPNTELRIAALRALAAQQDKEVPTLLMKLWPSAPPGVRREILEAMLRQPARVNVLLDEIEAKRLKASELDPLRTRQLTNHKDAGIRERAKKLLADNIPADRQKALKQYQAALDLKADARNGREVFKKNCAICHRVAGIGVDVGPDIADTRTKTLSALLNDIIVPNAAIDANYVNYVVSTKDGRILTGLLTAESASSITLLRAEKQTDVVLRKDIDEIASTGVSLMPDGLEQKISVQEMADLLSFLKNWRYLDGSVPLGK